MKTKILIVEDDSNIAELVKIYIEKEGYEGRVCRSGKLALLEVNNFQPDLMILDIMLPDLNGIEVCKQIRGRSQLPIIMLTAKGETFDKVLGLELGADDYIVKPFDPKELVARIKAVLRRFNPKVNVAEEVRFKDLMINKQTYLVLYKEQRLELPPKELELLFFLAAHPNIVFTRDQLLEKIWDYEYMGDSRTVDVHVKRLREKLCNEPMEWDIKTVWGVGYKFEVRNEEFTV